MGSRTSRSGVSLISFREFGQSVVGCEDCHLYSTATFRLGRLQGCGPVRLRQSVCQVLSLAFLLNAVPVLHDMRISLLADRIAEANQWLAQLLYFRPPRDARRYDRFARIFFNRSCCRSRTMVTPG